MGAAACVRGRDRPWYGRGWLLRFQVTIVGFLETRLLQRKQVCLHLVVVSWQISTGSGPRIETVIRRHLLVIRGQNRSSSIAGLAADRSGADLFRLVLLLPRAVVDECVRHIERHKD